ncbi:MAG TPA: hypothetical protein VN239_07370 [Nitrososphaera sp.]|jgi:hypothetical protein|nr:hypothetical protein [Nitrososphaera sp.]
MSVEEKLVNRIFSFGSAGIKKTDLRREFGDIDNTLENLISRGDIFVDKRANAYFCFHKSHYIQSLLNSDPRFRLTYEMIKSVDDSVSSSSKDLVRAIEILANNVSNLASLLLEMKNDPRSWLAQLTLTHDVPITEIQEGKMSVQEFKEEFDAVLANTGSSIGWIELANIRNKICNHCNISSEEFYRLVSELTNMHQEKYELSTGGREGVMVRGLLHGFVRCI